MTIKYFTKQVVFQEVPDEVSLSFSVSGCPCNCKGCSWKNTLNKLTPTELKDEEYLDMLKHYSGLASCVLFLGGEWDKDLINKLKIAKDNGYKTALYTGLNLEEVDFSILSLLDYIKVGRYIEELGGLDSKKTNQRFIDLKNNKIINYKFYKEI